MNQKIKKSRKSIHDKKHNDAIPSPPDEIIRARRINVVCIDGGYSVITIIPSGEKHFSLVVFEDANGTCGVCKTRITAAVKAYPIIKNLIGEIK